MKQIIFPLALLVAACGGDAGETPVNHGNAGAVNQASSPGKSSSSVTPALAGEWSVSAFNGTPLTQVFPMTAAFAGDRLTISSECVRMAWSYAQDGMAVSFRPAGAGGCGRKRTYNEDQVEKAIGSATMAMAMEDGREVQLSGSGGTVTLASR